MKKIIICFLFILLTSISCCYEYEYKVRVVYDVCWPDTTIRYDTVFICKDDIPKPDTLKVKVRLGSARGSNYIKIDPYSNCHMLTTAPIRFIEENLKIDIK